MIPRCAVYPDQTSKPLGDKSAPRRGRRRKVKFCQFQAPAHLTNTTAPATCPKLSSIVALQKLAKLSPQRSNRTGLSSGRTLTHSAPSPISRGVESASTHRADRAILKHWLQDAVLSARVRKEPCYSYLHYAGELSRSRLRGHGKLTCNVQVGDLNP